MGKHKKKRRDDPEENSKETEIEVHMIVHNGKHNLSTEVNGTAKNVSSETFTKKKKKKKETERESKPANSHNSVVNVLSDSPLEPDSTVAVNCEEEQTSPKKKKKKKKDKRIHSDVENTCNKEVSDLDDSNTRKRKRLEVNDNPDPISVNNDMMNGEDLDEVPRKKHKKKKSSKKKEMEENLSSEKVMKEVKEIKSSKKKETEENASSEKVVTEVNVIEKSKKKRKKKDKDNEFSESKRKENDDLQSKHDSYEIVKRHERKTAVSIKDAKESKDNPIKGQWETNAFGDEAKQNKFLRLLGGFKKGADQSFIQEKLFKPNKLSNSCNKIGNSSPKVTGSLAMNKSQQETYKRAMESEYNSAMSMHLNRGLGLGFQSAQKKLSIDTQQSKSKKFDDSD